MNPSISSSLVCTTICLMPCSLQKRAASPVSLLGKEPDSAVTAIILSPSTSCAILARYVESTPPEKATARLPRFFIYSFRCSSFCLSATDAPIVFTPFLMFNSYSTLFIHAHDSIAHMLNHRDIMRYKNHRQLSFFVQIS